VSPPLVVLCLFAGIAALAVACSAIYALVYIAGARPAQLVRRDGDVRGGGEATSYEEPTG
jgi:hypothetical protein